MSVAGIGKAFLHHSGFCLRTDSIGNVDKIKAAGAGFSIRDVVNSVEHYPWGPVSSFVFGNGESRSIVLDGDYENYVLLSGAHINRTFTSDFNRNIITYNNRSLTYDEMDRVETVTPV